MLDGEWLKEAAADDSTNQLHLLDEVPSASKTFSNYSAGTSLEPSVLSNSVPILGLWTVVSLCDLALFYKARKTTIHEVRWVSSSSTSKCDHRWSVLACCCCNIAKRNKRCVKHVMDNRGRVTFYYCSLTRVQIKQRHLICLFPHIVMMS